MPTVETQVPNEEWTLENWIEAVSGPTYKPTLDEISGLAFQIAEAVWPRATIGDWKAKGIPKRDNAITMIAVLRRIARMNRRPFFINPVLRLHARIFLASRACREPFAELRSEETWKIAGDAPLPPNDSETLDLLRRVQPPPPIRLYGRKSDINRTLKSLEDHLITIVDGTPGDGKTALAWFAAQAAKDQDLVSSFDWTTDKRHIVAANGTASVSTVPPLDFERVLRSMIERFNWTDLLGVEKNLKQRCAEKLRNGRYLIVLDNLETVEDSGTMVDNLLDMLHSRRARYASRSRVLITSRHWVRNPECKRLDIQGIEADERLDYIRHIEESFSEELTRLSNEQAGQLATRTNGNPLFIQIALNRYAIAPRTFEAILRDISSGENFAAFDQLFGPLCEGIGDDANWLACVASKNDVNTFYHLQKTWDDAFDRAYGLGGPSTEERYKAFHAALQILLERRILNLLPVSGDYVMHSLVGAYIRQRCP